ncbi:hypothetical protein [Prevotella jejuni]|nr:hypothetical protein [Prevotella jejuni]MBW4771382.1 hypothetical protein [Prevotella jejuni]QUB77506.1 hypothetical protein J4857_05820 [Prevotella jejuni]
MKIIRSLSFTVAQVVVNKVITNRRKEKRKRLCAMLFVIGLIAIYRGV